MAAFIRVTLQRYNELVPPYCASKGNLAPPCTLMAIGMGKVMLPYPVRNTVLSNKW